MCPVFYNCVYQLVMGSTLALKKKIRFCFYIRKTPGLISTVSVALPIYLAT